MGYVDLGFHPCQGTGHAPGPTCLLTRMPALRIIHKKVKEDSDHIIYSRCRIHHFIMFTLSGRSFTRGGDLGLRRQGWHWLMIGPGHTPTGTCRLMPVFRISVTKSKMIIEHILTIPSDGFLYGRAWRYPSWARVKQQHVSWLQQPRQE